MKVRAKFTVNSIERSLGNMPFIEDGKTVWKPAEVHSIKMSPVYGNGDPNHENTKFWNATPSGSLVLGTVNPSAVAEFEIGAEYYIDFIKAG